MRIRTARRDDFEGVTRLLEALGRPATLGQPAEDECRAVYELQVVDPNTHHIVAEDDAGVIIAFASLHFRSRLNWSDDEAWIPDLLVAEHARRRGIGRALLEEAVARAHDHGCHRLALESGYQRAEAHHMYRQFGMRDAGKYFYKALR